jgi:hypothetical protein
MRPSGTIWRVVGFRWAAEGDGHWHGRWQSLECAVAQAMRWQECFGLDELWLESEQGERIDLPWERTA